MSDANGNPIIELQQCIDSMMSHLEGDVSEDQQAYQQAAIDAMVNDVLPSLKRLSSALGSFVNDTVTYVNSLEQRVTALEASATEAGEDSDSEEDDGSSLTEEDAKFISEYVIATLGVIKTHVPPGQEHTALVERGTEILEFLKDALDEE